MVVVDRDDIPSLAVSTGSNLKASRSSGAVDLRDKREMECLSPISSAVSTLKVPRQFGHMGKTASKQQKLASHQVNHVIFHSRAARRRGLKRFWFRRRGWIRERWWTAATANKEERTTLSQTWMVIYRRTGAVGRTHSFCQKRRKWIQNQPRIVNPTPNAQLLNLSGS